MPWNHTRRLFLSSWSARALLACSLLWCGLAATRLEAQSYPAFRSFLGVQFRTEPSATGLPILQVSPNSAAAAAGVQSGDVLMAIDGRAVTSPTQVSELVGFHPPYDVMKLEIVRAGQRLTLEARPTGRMRLEALTPKKVFFIPGVDTTSPFVASDPIETLDSMNVLTRVLVDPASGTVEFIGSYDPAYDTGPLPYRQLLEAALRSPELGFSLDIDVETLTQMKDLRARETADFERLFGPGGTSQATAVWFRRWVDLILGHPLLEIDRQLFLDKMAGEVGLIKPELVDLFNYVNMGGITRPVPDAILDTQVRLLEHEGFTQGASAYRLYRGATTESLMRAAETLGQADEAQRLLGEPDVAGAPDAKRLAVLQAFVACRVARSLNSFNDQQAGAFFTQFRQGKLTLDSLDTWLQQRILPDRDASGRLVVYHVLNGFPLSNELLGYFYGVSVPQSVLRFVQLDGDTALGRILYEADYALKTIDMTQEIFHTIPGHRTFRQILLDANNRKSTPVRWTLVPRDVALMVSADRREVAFGAAQIELEGHAQRLENTEDYTDDQLAATQQLADVYRAQVNGGYERYAREYGSLHRLREAAKILALARWMNQERIALAPDASQANDRSSGVGTDRHAWTPPARVPGLFHVFMILGDVTTQDGKQRNSFLMPTTALGGVNFRTPKKWVSISPPPPTYERAATSVTVSAAIGQAAVNAAMNGDMETARSLAEQSAEAMQGKVNFSRLPSNVPMPPTPAPGASNPETAQLVKDTARIVRSMSGSGHGGGQSVSLDPAQRALLADVGRELNSAVSGAPVGTNFFSMLQTRQVGQPSPSRQQEPSPPSGEIGTTAAPSVCAQYLPDVGAGNDLTAKQKAFYDARLAETRQDLEKVQQAMANIGRLNQHDVAELQKWEGEVTGAYQAAQDRLMDAVGLLLVDSPLDILQKRQAEMREALDSGMVTSLLARKAAVTADEAAALDNQVFDLVKMKYRYENIYGQAERLEKTMAEAKATYDLDQWSNGDKSDFDKMKDGMMQLTEMALSEPALGGALKIGRLTSENLLRFLSLYKATAIAAGFVGDIVAQKLAWGPVMEQLERSIELNRQGLDHLRQRAAQLRQQIQCLESR
jgi:hypothetical protein